MNNEATAATEEQHPDRLQLAALLELEELLYSGADVDLAAIAALKDRVRTALNRFDAILTVFGAPE